jgi:hypothetical protein
MVECNNSLSETTRVIRYYLEDDIALLDDVFDQDELTVIKKEMLTHEKQIHQRKCIGDDDMLNEFNLRRFNHSKVTPLESPQLSQNRY